MRYRSGIVVSCIVAIELIWTAASFGEVDLGFTISGATPSSITVTPGSIFLISVVASSTSSIVADQMTGLDYHLDSTGSGANPTTYPFSISSRNTPASSSFSETFSPDPTVAGQMLNPSTQMDLGGNASSWPTPVSNGNFEVSDYKILVSANATQQNYTFGFLNCRYQEPSSTGFEDSNFASLGSFSVSVVAPEPACAGLMGLAGIGFLRRPRHRSV